MNFTSHYDAPVRLAALLVNGLTDGQSRGRPFRPGPAERGRTAAELLGSTGAGVPDLSPAEVERLAAYSARLKEVFAAVAAEDVDRAARQVDLLLQETQVRPAMVKHDEQGWHVHYRGTSGGLAGEWAGLCAAALAVVLSGDGRRRLGLCTAPQCDRVHVDTSYNGSRRFCSTACQSRVKAAAHRARS
jgi:predicted RNA-binding Zn ribbon-like protein